MTKSIEQERAATLAKLVSDVYVAVNEATDYADEHKLSFSLDITYGMGGTYDGDEDNRYVPDYVAASDHDGWYPSSQSC